MDTIVYNGIDINSSNHISSKRTQHYNSLLGTEEKVEINKK